MTRIRYLFVVMVLLLAAPCKAQVPVAPLQGIGHVQLFNTNGTPLAGGKVFFYQAGTTTPQATYTDSSGTAQNTNPLILDTSGFGTAYLINASYKICVQDQNSVQIWCQDNVSAYAAINNSLMFIFAPSSSDPPGVSGEMIYNSSIPCFRLFISSWDCILEASLPQTMINKVVDISANTLKTSTNIAGHYMRNNGTQYLDSAILTSDLPIITNSLPNFGGGGTVISELAVLSSGSNPATVTIAPLGATGGILGVCISGCGPAGNASVAISGLVSCFFDGSTTSNDYVQASATTAGRCHDSGPNFPTSGQVLGRVLATNLGAGVYNIVLFPAEIQAPTPPMSVLSISGSNLVANVAPVTVFTPAADGFYRITAYVEETTIAGTSSTLPFVSVLYTAAHSNVPETIALGAGNSGNTLGAVGFTNPSGPSNSSPFGFVAKGGQPVQIQTSGYASNPAAAMHYSYDIRIEGPL